ncbi:MAG: 5-formyltetrahydrofolate cyclo-ligase [Pseudomonadota bacterium]|nr:5-formyltetrahydrofolate cyclo-ligase [Pseudomonadota bacterium]
MTDKSAARAQALAARDAAADAVRAQAAQARLRSVLLDHRGKPLAGYLPMRSEVDARPVMAEMALHGPVGVPVTPKMGLPLTFRTWTPETPLVEGAYGTEWPAEGPDVEPHVLIVPLVAFDRAGNRLGYGGGFYDRTLEELRALRPTIAIGYAFAAQELPDLPLEPTDQPLDAIVTEAETLRFT